MTDSGTISAIGGAVRVMGSVVRLAKGIDKAELRTELQEQILDLQGRLLEVQSELGTMKEENERLRAQLSLRSMEYRAKDGMYWDGQDGPFCPHCVDGKGIRARVAKNPSNGFYVCQVCHGTPHGAPRPVDYS